jgi:dihydrofolate reductase
LQSLRGSDIDLRSREIEFYNREIDFRSIWVVGGGAVSGECLRLGLADEVRHSILPILIGYEIRFFDKLDRDVALHLIEVKAYKTGTAALCYEVRGHPGESRIAV